MPLPKNFNFKGFFFSDGAFANPLNSTLPIELVLLLGLLLALGLLTRPVIGFIFLWQLVIIGVSLWEQQSLYMGLEAAKRELGLLAGAFIYSSAGHDRFSWPKPSQDERRMTAGGDGVSLITD